MTGRKNIVIEEGSAENWDDYQPEVTVHRMKSYIQIKFIKKGADAINIYKRSESHTEWLFTATVTESPYDDYDIDSQEKLEYCFFGVLNKNEIGMPLIISLNNASAEN